MVVELQSILRSCGCWTTREEYGCFAETNPNDHHRPDISIHNPIDTAVRKELIDISVTCPLEGSQTGTLQDPTRSQALAPYRQSKLRYQQKMSKYGNRCAPLGFSFQPFVFESSGALDKHARDLLKKYAKKAAELRRIPAERLYRYFLCRMSMCLQRGISRSISVRLTTLNSHAPSFDLDRVFRYTSVMEYDQYRL